MKIRKSSWFSKLSNLFRDNWEIERSNDNLCWFFWRAILKLVGILITVTWIFGLGFILITDPMFLACFIIFLLIVCSIVVPIVVIAFLRVKNNEQPIGKIDIKDNILVKFLSAQKQKVCPIIEYVD